MVKRALTMQGQLDKLQPMPEREPIPPRKNAGWRQRVYILTQTHGVFYTADFVADTRYIAGVPTWATVNVGLNLAHDGLGFRGDPFDPAGRQYSLMEDALYRREAGGNWVAVLTKAAAHALCGGDTIADEDFGENGLNCNINHEGWVAVIYNPFHSGLGWRPHLIISTDFGATWVAWPMTAWQATGAHAASLTVGAYKGSSPYQAGLAIYAAGRHAGPNTSLYYTTDGGQTWGHTHIGGAEYTTHILVDPNDQSRVFVGCLNGAGPWNVGVSLDHGATVNQYDAAASEDTGHPAEATWYHLSVAMDDHKMVRIGSQVTCPHIHTTRDDGASWEEPSPQYSSSDLGISLVQDSPNYLYLLRQASGGAGPGAACHIVFASEDEGRNMMLKAGANACTMDTGGGDSIPYNCGGVRGILEVWTDLAAGDIRGVPSERDIGQFPGGLNWQQIEEIVGSGAEEVAPGDHDLLSVYHGDALPAVVSRGSLVVGNLTPLWSELVVGAAAGDVLLSDTVDASWGQLRTITVNDAAAGLIITQAGAGASLSLPSATTAAKGLILGGDVALYRDAANRLALGIDDTLRLQNTAGDAIELYLAVGSARLVATETAAGDWVMATYVVGDAQPRFIQRADGTMLWGTGAAAVDSALQRLAANVLGLPAGDAFRAGNYVELVDGIAAPGALVGFARIYVDIADGDLKVVFGDGFVATIAADS